MGKGDSHLPDSLQQEERLPFRAFDQIQDEAYHFGRGVKTVASALCGKVPSLDGAGKLLVLRVRGPVLGSYYPEDWPRRLGFQLRGLIGSTLLHSSIFKQYL